MLQANSAGLAGRVPDAGGPSTLAAEEDDCDMADHPAMKRRRCEVLLKAAEEGVVKAEARVKQKQAALAKARDRKTEGKAKVEAIARATDALEEARVWHPAHSRPDCCLCNGFIPGLMSHVCAISMQVVLPFADAWSVVLHATRRIAVCTGAWWMLYQYMTADRWVLECRVQVRRRRTTRTRS